MLRDYTWTMKSGQRNAIDAQSCGRVARCIDAAECKAKWNKQLCLHIVQVFEDSAVRCSPSSGLLGASPLCFRRACCRKLK